MSEIRHILTKHNFIFNKRFGQNFITDVNLLRAIVADSGIDSGCDVVEIGAGAGTLTKQLCKSARHVYSFEIDKKLKPVLEEVLAEDTNVTLQYEDILAAGTENIDKMLPGGFHVVANLPYYITTPIIMMFLEQSECVKSLTVMVQKEVAERLTAKAGSKEYGSITVAVNFAGTAVMTRTVPRSLFYPVPNVDSAIVRIDIDRDRYKVRDSKFFYKVYRAAFAMRRKTLYNNLQAAFDLPKQEIAQAIAALGKGADVRGERLTAEEFARLSDILYDLMQEPKKK